MPHPRLRRLLGAELRFRQVAAGYLVLVGAIGGDSQLGAQTVTVSPPLRAMAAPPGTALIEPHLAAHPTVAGHLVAGVIVGDTAQASGVTRCAALVSLDGGRTWQESNLRTGPCADPWVAVTGSGEAVLAFLGLPPDADARVPWQMLVARSADGGRSWNDSLVSLGGEHDREVLVSDPRAGAERRLYVVSGQGIRVDDSPIRWSVYVAASVNAGRSFREPTKVVPSTLNLNAGESTMLADGTLLVSFVDFQRNVDGFRSRDGMLERRRIWLLRSNDNGRHFSPPMLVSERCGASSYDVGAERTSGRIYVVCLTSDSSAVLIHQSRDRGESWQESAVVRRSQPDRALLQPRLAVAADGTVGVSWLELDGGRRCIHPAAAFAVDSTLAFTPAAAIATPACPDLPSNGFAGRRWPTGGDYFGWVVDASGDFQILWSRAESGRFELYSARLRVNR